METSTSTSTFALARSAFVMTVSLTVITGLVYPALVTGIAAVAFPAQAAGSIERENGRIVGSELIGRAFSAPGEFWGRPSATGTGPYNASASSGSNLGPTNATLATAVRDRVRVLRESDPTNTSRIPVDLVTASASGLDPDISPAAAHYQVPRVARVTHRSEAELHALIDSRVVPRLIGVLGEPRINVAGLNAALRRLPAQRHGEE